MQQVIIAIHLMVVTALVILVLYQKSEGGALGMGGSGVFTGRGQANALTRATGILATMFFITSIALTVLPAWERRSEGGEDWTKALDQGNIQLKEVPKTEGKGEQEKAPEPGKDSIFDQLQRAQQKRQQGAPVEAPPAATTPPAAQAPVQEPAAPAPQAPTVEPPKAAAPAPAEAPKPEAATPKSEAPAAPTESAPAAPVTPPAAEAPKTETPAPAPEAKPAESQAKPAAPETKPAEPENKPAPPTTWKAPTQ
jgi:protein translocase SecG subunit